LLLLLLLLVLLDESVILITISFDMSPKLLKFWK
jgi:hypothetical protein